MAVAETGPGLVQEIGGQDRRLLLRNDEIERFEIQYAPLGIYELWDQLFGRGRPPQSRHVRDLVALGLIGAGMRDAEADRVIAGLGPEHNLGLRDVAQRLLGVTFMPDALSVNGKRMVKKKPGSRSRADRAGSPGTMTPQPGSGTSAE